MQALTSYDPDHEETKLKVIKPERRTSERCEACGQKIEKKIPRNEVWKVIRVYRMAIGVKEDDKRWNDHMFPILYPTAKKLIDFMGSWELAADCVQDVVEQIKNWNDQAEISLQKIYSNHADKWKRDYQEKNR